MHVTHLLMALLKLAEPSRVFGWMASDMTGSGTLMEVMEYLRSHTKLKGEYCMPPETPNYCDVLLRWGSKVWLV